MCGVQRRGKGVGDVGTPETLGEVCVCSVSSVRYVGCARCVYECGVYV